MVNSASFNKSICSICHKDLEPFVDDLQAIFICGHVFHEFCLQESFGFFESVKRYSCPVCKQRCKPDDVVRLYFESVVISPELNLTLPPPQNGEDPEALRREVKQLREELYLCKEQAKKEVTDLKNEALKEDSVALCREVKELKDELYLCKEKAKKEVANLKNETLKQQASVQQTLHMKTEALDKLTVECLRLQERNRSLTKELACFKLASNLDLDEREILNLATLGNEGNDKNTIDVLKNSLILSNRNHKKLMTQCNLLEQGEACHHKKLEKAKGKINRLNTKVQNLADQCSILERGEARYTRKLEKAKGKINKLKTKVQNLKDQCNLLEQGEARNSRKLEKAKEKINTLKARVQELDGASEVKKEISVLGPSNLFESMALVSDTCNSAAKAPADDTADGLILDDVKQIQSMLNVTNESPIIHPLARPEAVILDDRNQVQSMLIGNEESPITQPLPRPASAYFSGGLVGPDGTRRFLGKWCKRSENNQSVTTKYPSIDVGGSIVVLSDDEDITENIPHNKRLKYEDQ